MDDLVGERRFPATLQARREDFRITLIQRAVAWGIPAPPIFMDPAMMIWNRRSLRSKWF